ncbi:MAG: transcriptional regulator, SarA/Rot family [Candidatus Heimdallarchaeaceae archaeon]
MTTHEIITQEKVLHEIQKICSEKEYTTLNELTTILNCHPSNLVRKIEVLVDRGIILKKRAKHDGRVNIITINEKWKVKNL